MNQPEVIAPGAFAEGGAAPNQLMVPLQTSAAMSAARAEVESALLIAKRYPRNESEATMRLLRKCERLGMAESAAWRFKRGGETIDGPSVYLARQAKICWGNMDAGFRALERDEESTLVEGYAIDRETNSTSRYQQRVKNLIQRKVKVRDENGEEVTQTRWVQPEERDYLELVARVGAKLERNAIYAIIPQDVIDAALQKAQETVRLDAAGKLSKSREETVISVLSSFDKLGITRQDIEGMLGHKVEAITETEYAELRRIWKSISDGQSQPSEFFNVSTGAARASERTVQDLKLRLDQMKGEPPAAGKAAEPAAAAAAVSQQSPANLPSAEPGSGAADPNKPATTKQRQRLIAVSREWMAATQSSEEDGRELVRSITGFMSSDTGSLNSAQLEELMAKMETEIAEAKANQ